MPKQPPSLYILQNFVTEKFSPAPGFSSGTFLFLPRWKALQNNDLGFEHLALRSVVTVAQYHTIIHMQNIYMRITNITRFYK